jgi:hypothetical protein
MSGRPLVLLFAFAAIPVALIVILGRSYAPDLTLDDLATVSDAGGPSATVRSPGATATDYPLQVEHWSEPKVAALRRQENLDRVVEGSSGEFDRFRRLLSWTRRQWPVGDPEPYPLCNGIDILAAIRSGKTGGFCGQYSYLLADALKSFGYFSVRYVELENPDGASHFAVEAWSNEFDKWVLLDPTYAAYYTDGSGVPENALELHEAWVSKRTALVRPVEVEPGPKDGTRIGDLSEHGLDFYSRFATRGKTWLTAG